jgi:hypothetical protein
MIRGPLATLDDIITALMTHQARFSIAMKKMPSSINLIIFLLYLSLCFVFAEIGFRIILFSNIKTFDKLRNPDYFTDYDSDDYWKLYYLFGGQYKPPKQTHPLLGWIGDFSRDSYIHNKIEDIGHRRPVLLYGDSFAACVGGVLCFQDILNKDETFSKAHYLLNYGVGGYGIDQIFLLFQQSIYHYDDPFVVISLMTLDLDRSILSVRTGQKPFFQIEDNDLKLHGIPINPNPDAFFSANPPQIKSYLYRRIIYSRYLPAQMASLLRHDNDHIRKKIQINEKIILEIVRELRSKNIDYIFLVFHPHWPGVSTLDSDSDWRDDFLSQLFHENNIAYIWSKELFQQDSKDGNHSFDHYIIPGNGHPTTHFNRIIAEELKSYILKKL